MSSYNYNKRKTAKPKISDSNKDDQHLRAKYTYNELLEKYQDLQNKFEAIVNIENEGLSPLQDDHDDAINSSQSYGYHQFDWNDPLLSKHLAKRNSIHQQHNKNNKKAADEDEKEENDNPKLKLLKFADIKRIAGNGYRALSGKGGIILRDGKYPVHKFVHDIRPAYIVVPIKWKSAEKKVGYIELDDGGEHQWDGSIPIMHATRSNVRFYGCCLDPSCSDIGTPEIQCKDGGMFDFSYTKYYSNWIRDRDGQKGAGGCRLERHAFAHIETPLDREGYSGVFVVGKLIEDYAICLTAFIIARGQTLYVPPYTIHTNDYQRGTWRTYLEVGDIDICDIVRLENKKKKPISLKFWCGVTKKRMAQYELPTFKVDENPNDDKKERNDSRHRRGGSFPIHKLRKDVSDKVDDDELKEDDDVEYYEGGNKFVVDDEYYIQPKHDEFHNNKNGQEAAFKRAFAAKLKLKRKMKAGQFLSLQRTVSSDGGMEIYDSDNMYTPQ